MDNIYHQTSSSEVYRDRGPTSETMNSGVSAGSALLTMDSIYHGDVARETGHLHHPCALFPLLDDLSRGPSSMSEMEMEVYVILPASDLAGRGERGNFEEV